MMRALSLFSDSDLGRIEAAVRDAEARSRGEIVVVAAPASGDYPGAAWTGACLGSLAALLALVLVHWLGDLWGAGSPFWALLAALGGAGAGYLAAGSSAVLKRLLLSDPVLADIVRGIREGRAAEALIAAIGRCGEILDRRGLERRGDDADELANRPRLDGEGC
jgi:uncharacterized membrane protein